MTTRAPPVTFRDDAVLDSHGHELGTVVVDLRGSYPKRRLVVEHGHDVAPARRPDARPGLYSDPSSSALTVNGSSGESMRSNCELTT